MKYDIVTIGDASGDIFIRPKGLRMSENKAGVMAPQVSFEIGAKIPVEEAEFDIGGSACNTAVGFSRLGLDTSTIIALGEDLASGRIFERLESEDVNTSNIMSRKEFLANFSVIFLVGDERTIFIHRYLKDYGLLAPKKSTKADWIYLGPFGEDQDKLSQNVLYLTSERNIRLAWNPGSTQINKSAKAYRALLKNTEIIFLNKEEAMKFIDIPPRGSANELIKSVAALGPKIVVITDGKKGADCFVDERIYHIDALTQKRVDATGAGDSFACGFAARIILAGKEEINQDIVSEALIWGIMNSSSVVNQIGAQKGLLTADEMQQAINANPRLSVETR